MQTQALGTEQAIPLVSEIQPSPVSVAIAAPKKRGLREKIILSVLLLVGVGGGGYFAFTSYFYVSTDNAMVQAPTSLLSSKVGGLIIRGNVQENQHVKAGEVLAEIRPDDYRFALSQAAENLKSLRAQMVAAEAAYNRAVRLRRNGVATAEEIDNTKAQLDSVTARANAAKSEVEQGLLNLDYTQIKAPVDGRIGKKSFEVGMLATPGQPLMGFVADNERWVVANFKETDMAHITVGKTAEIEVDALGSQTFSGVVESISPSTGATFSLLPPDNATGNFTKVVQRVPVRIKLQNLSLADVDRLQAGLSTEVTVKIR